MRVYQGQIASKGITIGKIFFLQNEAYQEEKINPPTQSIQDETDTFLKSHQKALLEIENLKQKALKEVGEDQAFIFEAHQMMLKDLDFLDFIREKINQGEGAVLAVKQAQEYFSSIFSAMEDEYMQARSADIVDICSRLLRILNGNQECEIQNPSIVMARDLTPSQTLQMKRENLLGFITLEGSLNSHTAILAKTMGIPALMGIQIQREMHQKKAIIDAIKGELIIDPTPEVLQKYENLLESQKSEKEGLQVLRGCLSATQSGQRIMLYANAGNLEDIANAQENDAEGIGLLRSEFLYLQKETFPTEEEQFEFYKDAVMMMQNKRVIVRTLDIGADKQIDYFGLEKEENPALGYRGIRICLDQKEIFKTQLRALLRASAYGKLALMFPMIVSLWEILEVKQILKEIGDDLDAEGIAWDKNLEIGVMIETPASVLVANDLAQEVDFFSIGTNDLTQYTLAIDRQNPRLSRFNDPYHPAILKMIQQTIQAGHQYGCWVGICGELAQEERAIEFLIKSGIDELSVSPNAILSVRQMIVQLP